MGIESVETTKTAAADAQVAPTSPEVVTHSDEAVAPAVRIAETVGMPLLTPPPIPPLSEPGEMDDKMGNEQTPVAVGATATAAPEPAAVLTGSMVSAGSVVTTLEVLLLAPIDDMDNETGALAPTASAEPLGRSADRSTAVAVTASTAIKAAVA